MHHAGGHDHHFTWSERNALMLGVVHGDFTVDHCSWSTHRSSLGTLPTPVGKLRQLANDLLQLNDTTWCIDRRREFWCANCEFHGGTQAEFFEYDTDARVVVLH